MEVEEKVSWPLVYLFASETALRLDLQSLQLQAKQHPPSQMYRCSTHKRRKKVSQLHLRASTKKRPLFRWVFVKTAEIPRVTLHPAAQFVGKRLKKCYGWSKSCSTLIGEHIYWFGFRSYFSWGDRVQHNSADLLKHNINDPRASSWKIVFSIDNLIPVGNAVFAPLTRKLYVFNSSELSGKIYDLDHNTWEDTKSFFCPYRRNPANRYYDKFPDFEPVLVEDESEILFYSLKKGCLIYFSLTNHQVRVDRHHHSLALEKILFGRKDFVPRGLEEAGDQAIDSLVWMATSVEPVLSNYTLYWFTFNLHLYGYDIKLKRWIRSPYLGDQLPTLTDLDRDRSLAPGRNPFLVDMRDGKLLAVVPEEDAKFTVALLSVVRNENSLSVTVESFHPLSYDADFFLPCTGMAV